MWIFVESPSHPNTTTSRLISFLSFFLSSPHLLLSVSSISPVLLSCLLTRSTYNGPETPIGYASSSRQRSSHCSSASIQLRLAASCASVYAAQWRPSAGTHSRDGLLPVPSLPRRAIWQVLQPQKALLRTRRGNAPPVSNHTTTA